MKYRPLGKTGLQVSAISMGCMRLPAENPDLAAEIVDTAIAGGINYFETTRGYIGGRCQHLTGPGLKGRSRGLIVSGKAGVSDETTSDSYRKEIELQMEILGVDYLEFFQVGWFSLDQLETLRRKGGALDALDTARDEGIVGHIGFTGHDTPENFTKLIETGLFDSLTIPYSLLNRSYSTTIERAGQLGVGVVAMCPVAGGMLGQPSEQVQFLITGGAATTAEAAFRFVLSNPSVGTACSGMNTLEQLSENLATADAFEGANEADLAQMERILDEFSEIGKEFCTGCRYCMDCPQGVDIAKNFSLYNYARVYGLTGWARQEYERMELAKRAGSCEKCGECEPKCPNQLPIMAQLEQVDALLRTG